MKRPDWNRHPESNEIVLGMRCIYLIQHPGDPSDLLGAITRNNDVDYRVLTFKEEVSKPGFLFAPNTTWTTGRNLLLSSIDPGQYDYVFLLDGDIELISPHSENSYLEFQNLLAEHRPYIATPHLADWHNRTGASIDRVIAIDACFNAFRSDKIADFLPYVDKYDHVSWWYSQLLVYDKIYASAFHRTLQFNDFSVINRGHGEYPQASDFNRIIQLEFQNKHLVFNADGRKEPGKINLFSVILSGPAPTGDLTTALLPSGLKFSYAADDLHAGHAAAHGAYRPYHSNLLIRSLRPGDVFLDIGARIGYHTLLAAEAVGPSGVVVALEPDPARFAILQQNIRQNGLSNVLALNLALGATEGTTVCHATPDDAQTRRPFWSPATERCSVEVPLTTATSVWNDHMQRRQVAVVRIDRHGFEPQVIQGMHELIAACLPAIFLEFSDDDHQLSSGDTRAMFDSLAARYSMVMVDEPARKLHPASYANSVEACQTRDESNLCTLIAAPAFLAEYLTAAENVDHLTGENSEFRAQLAEAVKLRSMLDTVQFELEKIRAESSRRAAERDRAKATLAELKKTMRSDGRPKAG